MLKSTIIGFVCLLLMSCSNKDAQYYREHPLELQTTLKQCPEQSPGKISCDELKKVAVDVNRMAYALQSNPQGFGDKIIELQSILSQKKIELAKSNTPQLQQEIDSMKQELANRLAIVKWLESPES